MKAQTKSPKAFYARGKKIYIHCIIMGTLAANPVLANKIVSYKISDSGRIVATVGHILKEDGTGNAYWEQVRIVGIAVGAVTTNKINNAATTPPKTAHVIDIVPIDAAPPKKHTALSGLNNSVR